jgi:hypothetical protein
MIYEGFIMVLWHKLVDRFAIIIFFENCYNIIDFFCIKQLGMIVAVIGRVE